MPRFENRPVYSTDNLDDLSYVLERLAPAEKLDIVYSCPHCESNVRFAQRKCGLAKLDLDTIDYRA